MKYIDEHNKSSVLYVFFFNVVTLTYNKAIIKRETQCHQLIVYKIETFSMQMTTLIISIYL